MGSVDGYVKDYVDRHQNLSGKRVIGITVEMRPDQVGNLLVDALFRLGVTKIEIGVQSLNNEVLEFNNRGHGVEAVKQATAIIKDRGLKIGYHMLYGMPGSSIEIDINSTKEIFSSSYYHPDHVKLYFCEMFKREYMQSQLVKLYDTAKWKPYDRLDREELLRQIIPLVPEYVRISRIGRKAATCDLEASRPEINRDIYEKKYDCKCIRCRELNDGLSQDTNLNTIVKHLSDKDLVIQLVTELDRSCIGILRVRLTQKDEAVIRELHVYGEEAMFAGKSNLQHNGFGKMLLDLAEIEVGTAWKVERIGVASGVGVRRYFVRHGYVMGKGDIMWKALKKAH